MRFSEYYKCFDDENKIAQQIQFCARKYLSKIMSEQTISIGKPSAVKFDENNLSVISDKKSLNVKLDSYKTGTSLCLEVYINNDCHNVLINPLYFREANIKNYLRECEIHIKRKFYEIRKSSK